jgi:hypothetical protein
LIRMISLRFEAKEFFQKLRLVGFIGVYDL